MATVKTLTVYPSGYVSDDYAYDSASNIENGYNSADNTTYATINLTMGTNAETYIYYTFDLSAIPDGAVITSVSCSANVTISSTINAVISSYTMQLYSGTTAKGSVATMTSTSAVTAITAGDWTADELSDCRLKLYAKRSSLSFPTEININFYGASLTVEYAEPEIIPIVGKTTLEGVEKTLTGGYCNIGGVWKTICKSYSNINGVWKPTYWVGEVTFTWKRYDVNVGDDAISYKFNKISSNLWYVGDEEDVAQWGEFYNNVLSNVDYLYNSCSLDSTTGVVTYSGTKYNIETTWSSLKEFRDDTGTWTRHCQYNGYHYYLSGITNQYSGEGVEMRKQEIQQVVTEGEKTQGSYIDDVTSSDYNAYPENGVQDGYWYVRQ